MSPEEGETAGDGVHKTHLDAFQFLPNAQIVSLGSDLVNALFMAIVGRTVGHSALTG